MSIEMSVELKGPIFKADAPAEVRALGTAIIQELVEKGEERLNYMLRPRPAGVFLSVAEAGKGKASTGNYRRNVHEASRMVNPQWGRISDGGVVYGPWLEGVSSRNQTTRFKGYTSFRRVFQWLQEQVRPIAEAHLAQFKKRMN